MSTEVPSATVGWPDGRPLYWTSYYPDEREVLATVRDHHGTHLFTVIRARRDGLDEATGNPGDADSLISREVVRRLQQED